MRLLALSFALFLPLVAACDRTDGASESDAAALQRRAKLEVELKRKTTEIQAEITSLGPEHDWAGRYFEGDGMCENVRVWLAPRAGCAAEWLSCSGLVGVNWGSVVERDGRLHLTFERPNTPGEFGHFEAEYEIVGSGRGRTLKPRGDRVVLSLCP